MTQVRILPSVLSTRTEVQCGKQKQGGDARNAAWNSEQSTEEVDHVQICQDGRGELLLPMWGGD
ncbi:MAG: hypothetical protein VW868_08940 [Bacteroidota bacterium]